jgi:ribulose-phosphate 3-epimerase
MKIKIASSILSADFGDLNDEIKKVEPYVDAIHVDIMDGHFVPNMTFGAPVVAKMKSKKPLHAHLMIDNPDKFIADFAKAGVEMIIVHSEACKNLKATILKIKKLKVKAGVSIKPKTKVSAIKNVLNIVDEVLVMTVEPGFGGQEFMKSMLPKIKELRKLKPNLDIAVDGGVSDKTAKLAIAAGANVLAAGSYIFKAKDKKKVVMSLKK